MVDIVLDPGHGGHHPQGSSTPYGTRAPDGTLEKDLTLDVCARVARRLGGRVALTRSDDDNLSLAQRMHTATRLGARTFVSIHADRGAEPSVWVHPDASGGSLSLAHGLARSLGAPVYQGELAVLSQPRLGGVSACMVELGDAADPRAAGTLLTEHGRDSLAARIAVGLAAPPAQHQYQQTMPNSCGAASLLTACLELGTATIPQVGGWPLWSAAPIPLAANLACELALYSVTSGRGGMPPARTDGYSLPSYVHECATALGRTAVLYLPNSLLALGLKFWYSDDLARARLRGLTIHAQAAPLPLAGQRLLRVMRVGPADSKLPATGLHYVMQRPNGSVMDPGTGLDYNPIDALYKVRLVDGAYYADTGIGLMIS